MASHKVRYLQSCKINLGFYGLVTEDGLNRYNGYTFKVFRPDLNNPATISDRWITSLIEDSQGYIWIGPAKAA